TTVVTEGKTDGNGSFSLNLPTGEYRLEVTAPDFRPYQQTVRVTPNMAPLSIPMIVATANTTVDVPAQSNRVSIESDSSLTATTISGDAIKDLPEDEDQLMAYLQQIAAGAGAAGGTASVVVDGFGGGRVPARDQIQQIIIETNVFSAEGLGGPRIQIITKPGTGPWRGSAGFSFLDESLNAMTPYDRNKPA